MAKKEDNQNSNPSYDWKKVMSGKDVETVLLQNNWKQKHQTGSHRIFEKNSKIVVVPMHKEIATGTLSNIKRMVNLAEN